MDRPFSFSNTTEADSASALLLADPSLSHWIKTCLSLALTRDCVDAARDAELLLAYLDARAEAASKE